MAIVEQRCRQTFETTKLLDQIVGRDTVEASGGRVVLVPVEQGYSTTSIIEKIKTS